MPHLLQGPLTFTPGDRLRPGVSLTKPENQSKLRFSKRYIYLVGTKYTLKSTPAYG